MSRYNVGVLRDFIASHFLIGGDWGRENQPHAHQYRLEVVLTGDALDRHGYLLDIAVVKEHLDRVVSRFENRMLNDLPELEGRNPGLEPFARALGEALARGLVPALPLGTLTGLTVKLWENEAAYATYTIPYA
jgi:6-pyruvoyltetrahydropterin/6-carboxytetrahydropterin synthase